MYWVYFLHWEAGLDIREKDKNHRGWPSENVYLWWPLLLLNTYYYKSLFIGLFTSILLPLISFSYPKSILSAITEYIIPRTSGTNGSLQEESYRNIPWSHPPLPSAFYWGSPLDTGSIWCVSLWQEAGWRRVKSGSGGANRKYTAQQWACIWGSWMMMSPWSYICLSSSVGGLHIHWALFYWGK